MIAVERNADIILDECAVHGQRALHIRGIDEIVSILVNHFVEKIDVGLRGVLIEILEEKLCVFKRIVRHWGGT